MSAKQKIIMGMGNAVLDVLIPCDDHEIMQMKLKKGIMTVVEKDESSVILEKVKAIKKTSGGSVANSIVGISELGGDAVFCGRVKEDDLGIEFIKDIEKAKVRFLCKPSKDGIPTAKCLIFITPDGERTMQTFLGASVNLSEDDIIESHFKNVSMLFIEGYLWSSESARKAIKKAVRIAKNFKIKVIFSLSDPQLVKSFRNEFLDFIKLDTDIVIGNNVEFCALYNLNNDNQIQTILTEHSNKVNVVTTGKEGAFCVLNQEIIKVNAIANIPIIDTTGAGDLFAAGFINSYNNGLSIERSLQNGCELAAKIIQQFGARLEKS